MRGAARWAVAEARVVVVAATMGSTVQVEMATVEAAKVAQLRPRMEKTAAAVVMELR